MKTTVEIADDLFTEAKALTSRSGLSFRSLVETGLRQVLEARRTGSRPFRLRKRAFGGRGLADNLDWKTIREKIYGGRGGRGA